MDEGPAPLATAVNDVIAALGRTVRRELGRTLVSLVTAMVVVVLLVVVAIVLVVVGVMRLADALAHACGHWFGSPALGDLTAGLVLLAVPLVGVLILRVRTR